MCPVTKRLKRCILLKERIGNKVNRSLFTDALFCLEFVETASKILTAGI